MADMVHKNILHRRHDKSSRSICNFKVAAEETLINLCELNKIEWVIAVPHNIIGPTKVYDPFRNVVSIMLNRMLQNKAPIIYGDGEQKRCFSYIDDCLSCLIPMRDQANLNKQIINIGPDEEFVTINKVAKYVQTYPEVI